MISLKNRKQSGFTIVELLIVIVIIGILAGLVITQILGANQKARDTERKTDINAVANQLETYFAKTGGFPVLDDINDPAWRKGNEVNAGDNNKSFADPTQSISDPATVALVSAGAINSYAYVPSPDGCASPTDADGISTGVANPCLSFTLTAYLENKNDSQKDSTSTPDQAYYIKRSANQE